MRIKPAVETNHQRHPCFGDNVKTTADTIGIKVNRLFAENSLARAAAHFNLVSMKIGWRADDNTINFRISDDRFNIAHLSTIAISNGLRRRGLRVSNGNKRCVLIGRDGPGMDLTDTPGTENCKFFHDCLSIFYL